MPNINSLIRDIYTLMESKEIPEGVNLEAECERFGKEMGDVMLASFNEQIREGNLRLSAIGKPDRKLYNAYHGVAGEPLRGPTYIKFLYGHLVESMVLSLARIAGHEVTDQQKRVEVNGVYGHIDGRIDGVLMDVKSSSSYGFKKFRNNTLHEDDSFGYIPQLRAYAHAEGESVYGWLAMDKQNGTLAWLQYDEDDEGAPYAEALDWSVPDRIDEIKKLVGCDFPPQLCYEPVPDGRGGNMKLDTGCSYCDYKFNCWPDVQTFVYSTGPRYLTKVVKQPRVMEIPDDF